MARLARLDPAGRVSFVVKITHVQELDRLDRTGLLAKVSSMGLLCGTACARRLGTSKNLASLRSLAVMSSEDKYPFCSSVSKTTAITLAQARLPSLRALYVAAPGEGIAALAGSSLLGGVTSLSVCTDARGVAALGQSPLLTQVDELNVASDQGQLLGGDAIRSLVQSSALGQSLRVLRFFGSDSEAEHSIGTEGIIALARWARLPRLRELDLRWNPVSEEAVANLVRSPLARQLARLDLCHTGFGTVVADALVERPLVRLTYLCVSGDGDPEVHRSVEQAYRGVLDPEGGF